MKRRTKVRCPAAYRPPVTDLARPDPLMSECLVYQLRPGRTMVRMSTLATGMVYLLCDTGRSTRQRQAGRHPTQW